MSDPQGGVPTFTVVAEDRLGAKVVHTLVDRILIEKIEWAYQGLLKDLRQWQTFPNERRYYDRKHAVLDQKEHFPRVKFHGQFKGHSWASEALHYKSLFLLYEKHWGTQFLFVARDGDKPAADRHEAFKAVYQEYQSKRPEITKRIILAFAIPEVEAWLIAGFEEQNDKERQTLKLVKQELGFNPVEHPERLTSNNREDKKDAKRRFGELCCGQDQSVIEDRCLKTSLETLKQNGQKCGLANFINQIQSKVLPLLEEPR